MLDISVIIVNYNVRYFIEQCLTSVLKAKKDLNIEIIVVDNNSVDNSVAAIRKKFPTVNLIANKENVGFAKANNQAIKISKGKYFLLLNPDTLIEEDTLVKIYNFMEKNPDAGALGVKLIDGEGKFLPESKRSLPTLLTSLYRFVGLSKIFPKSKIFNKYNLGHLDDDKTYEVDVLCGAFMFIRCDILPSVGYLDEDFFMYGEDIDYSYRIKNAGYKIYYFHETTIIHFKGESTKKSSLKYHNIFYKAMAIFAKKHYGGKSINPLLWLINIAVFVLAFINYSKSILKKFLLPILDFIIFFIVLLLVQRFWASFHFNDPEYYDTKKSSIIYLGFAFIWLISIFFNDGYKRNRFSDSIRGLAIGSIIILVIYSLLPESYR
jgi:GT2 family glycosyltransferase